jgi:hypothetical protein
MSIRSAQVSVGTTPKPLGSLEADHRNGNAIAVTAPAGADLYLGGPDVTSTTGFRLAAGGTASLDLSPSELLYGVLASGTGTVFVLQTGV